MKQTAVRIPDEMYERLKGIAARTGRTATFYIREAIEAHIDELEDLYLAEKVLATRHAGGGERLSLEQASRELGLDD